MINIAITSKAYGDVPVLGEIQLSIPKGKTFALLGPSGIGKTTFLNIVSGLDTDFEGKVSTGSNIGIIFQEPTLLPWRSVIGNITLLTGVSVEKAKASLVEFQLDGKEEMFPGQLSLGQQRRLSIARAFAAQPDFLIMDEPFTSLDETLADEMIALTKEVIRSRNVTTLLVTHSKHEANALADEILLLQGSPATLKLD